MRAWLNLISDPRTVKILFILFLLSFLLSAEVKRERRGIVAWIRIQQELYFPRPRAMPRLECVTRHDQVELTLLPYEDTGAQTPWDRGRETCKVGRGSDEYEI